MTWITMFQKCFPVCKTSGFFILWIYNVLKFPYLLPTFLKMEMCVQNLNPLTSWVLYILTIVSFLSASFFYFFLIVSLCFWNFNARPTFRTFPSLLLFYISSNAEHLIVAQFMAISYIWSWLLMNLYIFISILMNRQYGLWVMLPVTLQVVGTLFLVMVRFCLC